MPGKGDYGKIYSLPTPQGQYFPGSKEFLAWDEGWVTRYTAGSGSAGQNPHVAGSAKHAAWGDGWSSADANSSGTRKMPYISGTPPA